MKENNMFKWCSDVMKRSDSEAMKVAMEINLLGKRERERLEKRWRDSIENNLCE